ncbi:hypothetical protein SDC9_179513 [bioreactor metagenome]|uniref:HTH-type transcriptional repressor KstR2 C-terminal domain-containing protein n=1 Tax=bioreactor metagenome TaxID=1076179 RepID=A0A645GZ39_9ZZZZ
MKAVYKAQLGDHVDGDAVMSYNRDLYSMFSRILAHGIARGEFRADLEPDMQARQLMLAIRGVTFEWCIRYPEFGLKAQALAHFSLLLKGLCAENAPKP